MVSGADDSLFGGLRVPDLLGKGLGIIIVILLAVIAEIFGNFFRVYPALDGCFLRIFALLASTPSGVTN